MVPTVLAKTLDAHIAINCANRSGPLFPGPRGGRLTPSGFRKGYFYPAIDKALGQAGRDELERRKIRPHDLRHVAATIMITNGT